MGKECGIGRCVDEHEEEAKDGKERHGLVEIEENIIRNIMSTLELFKRLGVKTSLFLSSDTVEAEKIVMKRIPTTITVPGLAVHTSKVVEASDMKTATDFFMMALSDVCFKSQSTFGGMAFAMGGCLDFGSDSSLNDVKPDFKQLQEAYPNRLIDFVNSVNGVTKSTGGLFSERLRKLKENDYLEQFEIYKKADKAAQSFVRQGQSN